MSTGNTRVENYSLLVSGSPTIHKVADGMCHGMGSPLKEPPPPLGDRLTPSLTVMLANAKFWSFYCKLFQMISTGGFPTALECTKLVFYRGSAPDPTGELTALPRPSSWFKGPYFYGKGEGR